MNFSQHLNNLARRASQRSDVIIVAFMLMAIVMMIIPLPTYMVDMLIALNIALSILILIVAFYISHSVEFSALPPLILLSTLFRLSLSITTTRLILLDGNAGHIVKAFGDFVIAGQVVVGLVVFLIITVAQFVVITKGAERVAEVAARFTLDAMPGKQMSIDNDLRNGDIDQAEARRRRSRLERESQMFGAMDGAMKFVKGDAIAGLVILLVNLLGGMLIGMLERGMSFANAVHTYSLLTVGDGLIAQIPALLISVAAGTVVTRVNSDGVQGDLGTEILRQLGASRRALILTALILAGVSLLPGFPSAIFIGLALIIGGVVFGLHRRERLNADAAVEEQVEVVSEPEVETSMENLPELVPDSRVLLVLGPALAEVSSVHSLRQKIEALCHEIRSDLGVEIPLPGVYVDNALGAEHFRVEFEGVPVSEGAIPAGRLLLQDDSVHLNLLEIPGLEADSPLSQRPAQWVDARHEESLRGSGTAFLFPDEILRAVLERSLRRYAGDFLGIQETRQLLGRLESGYGELVKEALRVVPLQRMAETLRHVVGEGVSIRNQRALMEAMVEWGARENDAARLGEHMRAALARQICHQYADRNRVISAFVLSPQLEEQLRAALRRPEPARELVPEEVNRSLISQLRQACDKLPANNRTVLLVHTDLRRGMRRLVQRAEVELPVLSFRELTTEYNLQALVTLGLPDAAYRRTTAGASVTSLANAS
ncbi:type III secretion system export apparatus subunit SctV [Pseudomonas gingeri]|uniref:type III secretion system export apparatus subunit SctV n=1 Tax=Pseudomonas gingeri TaxID=117681 RepID=UPI0015A1AC8D|nr:type III secretion system export apparatus subunit SctV [Pseudomonas gingeri]NWD07028.1 type III secretion system export apparatus subunit SctV [Pseudomonas gingeri]NWE31627.1 type III secretion system export apparatus subunit SctV [Pseudomonas gingeri]NWE57356.1 type III secretion system export apparatus subunit SctV [Pseudomonas gingeri]NWF00093.1 type III secretion system export apparatus subunit SctV [Pseudomonas gingeri]